MPRRKHDNPEPRSLEVSDDGHPFFLGSYVRMTEAPSGMVELEVGDNCVVTVRETIPLSVLAMALTYVKDKGWRTIAQEAGWDAYWVNQLVPNG